MVTAVFYAPRTTTTLVDTMKSRKSVEDFYRLFMVPSELTIARIGYPRPTPHPCARPATHAVQRTRSKNDDATRLLRAPSQRGRRPASSPRPVRDPRLSGALEGSDAIRRPR